MITARHFINGIEVKPPINHKEIKIKLNFGEKSAVSPQAVDITSFQWVNETAKLLTTLAESGQTGQPGIFMAPTHELRVADGVNTLKFQLAIHLTEALFGRHKGLPYVEAESKPFAEIDWVNDVAEGISFEVLRDMGLITKDNYVFCPYIISSVPDYKAAFLTKLTLIFTFLEVKKVTIEVIAAASESSTIIDSFGGIINFIAKVAYMILLFITILELILDLFALIIQKVKYIPGMYVNDLIRIAASYLGLKYASPVLENATYKKLVLIPESFDAPTNPDDSRIKGLFKSKNSNQRGHYNGTFAQLLREIIVPFGLKVVVDGETLRLLPAYVYPTTASFTIPKLDQVGYRTNAKDLYRDVLIEFSPDASDRNTVIPWKGNNVNVFLEHTNAFDQRLNLLGNGITISIRFSRVARKTSLTVPEEIAAVLLEIVDGAVNVLIFVANEFISGINAVIDFINDIGDALEFFGINIPDIPEIPPIPTLNLSGLIENRKGMMLLENDNIGNPRLVLINKAVDEVNTKVAPENADILNAKYLYLNHLKGINQQFKIREYENVKMNLADVIKVSAEAAVVLETNGKTVIVDSCNWSADGRIATFVVKEPFTYAAGLKEVINEPNGS